LIRLKGYNLTKQYLDLLLYLRWEYSQFCSKQN